MAAVDQDQRPASGESQNLVVKASVDPAEPGTENMVFHIELSRAAEQTIVLIYGTVEGTAKAGKAFEPQQGAVPLAPGTKSAEVRVSLIEQPAAKEEKRFELFLAADPKVAEVVDQRIMATINGKRRDAQPEPDAPVEEQGSPRGVSAPAASRPRLTGGARRDRGIAAGVAPNLGRVDP